jgi:GntR family transcriptional repressor for pyruvate dehydrogenase complex
MPTAQHETIADVLIDEILRGQYRTGERLPSERDLSARFDTNRGSVRVAIKKLEQLGIADVQPGGVRVRPIEDANLDVIGALLALDDVPDPDLMEQTLEVMGTLMRLAAKRALERATDSQIEHARELLRRTRGEGVSPEQAAQTRLELGQLFMTLSGNLVLRLIGNSLHVQVLGRTSAPPIMAMDPPDAEVLLDKLDDALATRRASAAVTVLERLMALNTQHVVNTLLALRGTADRPTQAGSRS